MPENKDLMIDAEDLIHTVPLGVFLAASNTSLILLLDPKTASKAIWEIILG